MEKKRAVQVATRDKQIEILSEELSKSKDQNPWLWMSIGGVAGTVLTVTTVVIVNGMK